MRRIPVWTVTVLLFSACAETETPLQPGLPPAAPSHATASVQTGLLAYYPLNGNANDVTGNGFHGRILGDSLTAADRFGLPGMAMNFDGTGDKIVLPGEPTNARTEGTLSLWMKVNGPTTSALCGRQDLGNSVPFYCEYNIFAKQDAGNQPGFRAQLVTLLGQDQPWNTFYFWVTYPPPPFTYAPQAAYDFLNWHLYTYVWSGTGKQVYIDTSLVINEPGAFTSPSSGDLYLGDNSSNLVEYELLNGALDDVRIYDRALTEQEVSNLYLQDLNAVVTSTNVFIGLKNSDDVGTKFDLRAEILKNGVVVAAGQLDGVNGGSSGFNNAVKRTINTTLSSAPSYSAGEILAVRLSVRIAVGVAGHSSGTARLWYGDPVATSAMTALVNGAIQTYYLAANFNLTDTPGAGPRKYVDVLVNKAVGGNPFKLFGTWTKVF